MGSTSGKHAPARRGPRPRGLVKRTIVMTKTRDAAVRRAVAEGRAPSASGYIERALEAFETVQSYDEFLDEWCTAVGGPTAEERAWAEAAVRDAMRGTRRRGGRSSKAG